MVVDVLTTRPFAMVLRVVHCDDEGAGCAAGVTGSPCWNVEAP